LSWYILSIVDGKAIVTYEVFRNYDVSTVWLCDGWGNLPMLWLCGYRIYRRRWV